MYVLIPQDASQGDPLQVEAPVKKELAGLFITPSVDLAVCLCLFIAVTQKEKKKLFLHHRNIP